MSAILLDTSAYSAFFRGNPGVKAALQEADEIVLNPIVLGELHAGFRRGRHHKKNERELASFLDSPRVRTVPIGDETSEHAVA